jgi:hypothetical protein
MSNVAIFDLFHLYLIILHLYCIIFHLYCIISICILYFPFVLYNFLFVLYNFYLYSIISIVTKQNKQSLRYNTNRKLKLVNDVSPYMWNANVSSVWEQYMLHCTCINKYKRWCSRNIGCLTCRNHSTKSMFVIMIHFENADCGWIKFCFVQIIGLSLQRRYWLKIA